MRIRSSKSNQKLGCTFKQLKMVSRRKYAAFGKIKTGAQWLYISSLVIDSNPFLHGFDMLYLTVLVIIPCFLLAYSCHCGISCLPIFGKNCPTMSERNRPAFLFKPTWPGWNSLYNEWMCNTLHTIIRYYPFNFKCISLYHKISYYLIWKFMGFKYKFLVVFFHTLCQTYSRQ